MGNLEGGSKKRALDPTAPCHCILSQTALPSLIRAPGQKQETHARAALDWFFIPCVDGLFPRLLMTRWHFRRPSFADASAPTRKKAANGRARRHPLASTRRPHALACVRDEDVLRSVHVRARRWCAARTTLMCASCDDRCVARRRPLAGKKEDGWPRRNLRGSAGEARGACRRSTRAGVPPAALAAHRGAVLATSGARSLTPSLPRRTLLSVLTQHSPPTRSSPNTSASRSSRPWRSPCATSSARALNRPAYRIPDPPAELFALARRPERPRARARAPFAGASGRATPAGAFSALRRLSI